MGERMIEIYTDGACKGNPGIGAWAYIVLENELEIKSNASVDPATTNNRMELLGVIEALSSIEEDKKITLYVDSQYVKNGCESWMTNWKRNGWRTASGSSVKNQDLWERLDVVLKKHDISFVWVKGHSGNEYNDKVDALANVAIEEYLKKN